MSCLSTLAAFMSYDEAALILLLSGPKFLGEFTFMFACFFFLLSSLFLLANLLDSISVKNGH